MSLSSNIVNNVTFLRTTREFPTESDQLSVELNKAYLDIANVVNSRIIGIFPKNKMAITGESYFLTNNRQQTLRQVYTGTSTAAIPHGLTNIYNAIPFFTRMWGQYTDSTGRWFGLIPASTVAIAGQVTFYIDNTSINFVSGDDAPTPTSLIVIIEWMSNA